MALLRINDRILRDDTNMAKSEFCGHLRFFRKVKFETSPKNAPTKEMIQFSAMIEI